MQADVNHGIPVQMPMGVSMEMKDEAGKAVSATKTP
jgi:hypothetical protein